MIDETKAPDPDVIEGEIVLDDAPDPKRLDAAFSYEHNPRKISDKERRSLEANLKKLGDLSGIVYCRNAKSFVGGNQRGDIMDGSEIQITEELDRPNAQRTVARGWILFEGEKFAYREVAFSEDEFDRACITANALGGTWDYNKLAEKWAGKPITKWGLKDAPEAILRAQQSKLKQVTFQARDDGEKDYFVKVRAKDQVEAQELFEKLTEAGFGDVKIQTK